MGSEPQKRQRRSIRLMDYDYTGMGAYFITICTRERECLFGDIVGIDMRLNRLGEIVDECWRTIPVHFVNVELDTYGVMPNHVHGIILIVGATHAGATHASPLRSSLPAIPHGPKRQSIGAIIGSYKSEVSTRINEIRATPGQTVWQRNYYEHIIRGGMELDRIRKYIEMNPVRWAEDRENPNCRTKQ